MSLAIETFTDHVRHFCKWEESGKHDVETARQLLLALMQGVPYLVVADNERDDEPEYPRREHEGWQWTTSDSRIFHSSITERCSHPANLMRSLPSAETFTTILLISTVIFGMCLQALDRGDGIYAVSYWRESYFQHWGQHASSAIYAIDEYYRKTKLGEQDAAGNSRRASQ